MSILDTLSSFRADPDFMRDVMAWERAPAEPARHAPFPPGLQPRLVEALKARGIVSPYTHQSRAIESVMAGRHTVVVASAASGKSLCFQAPIANSLLQDPNACALCLYPTKALAQDQQVALAGLVAETTDSRRQTADNTQQKTVVRRPSPVVATYDGDTPQGRRADIRRDARIVITNADMLHVGILPHHTRWASFLRNLKYVVIDEMHVYRGVFGSHVANVVRRLRRLCAFYGSNPVFILASATTANPREHAERLIEAPVALVDDDGSPHGERHVLIANPPMVDAELGLRRSSLLVAPEIAGRFIAGGAQTICFARSRQDMEVLLTYLRKEIRDWRLEIGDSLRVSPISNLQSPISNLQSPIAGYRGGYLPEERRAIEAALRSGAVRGVVATNALELGIDIGELDACVMLGYPGSIASFWQQTGRAGRRRNASVAVMVASATALDQYLALHPEYLFKQTPEHARIAPDNLGILAAHLACATFELPFARGDRFGQTEVGEILDALAEEGEIHASDASAMPLFRRQTTDDRQQTADDATRYTWVGESYPADRISLRGVGERVIIQTSGVGEASEDAQPRLIGETERSLAPSRVHLGAIYLHQGQIYQIVELDWEGGRAIARAVAVDYYTEASVASEVVVLAEQGSAGAEKRRSWGEIEVTSRATRYRQVQFNTHRTLGWGEIDLPEQHLLTNGYWFCVPEEAVLALARAGVLKMPNDYGPNWARQRDAARARDGQRCAICGAPERPGRQHDVHHKKPFRQFGYIRGQNENYLQANALDNLITVCANCHQKVELAEATRTALQALAYLVGNLASLFVMCDPSDLATVADIQSPHTRLPTITLYEMTPGGTGLVEELFEHHSELLDMAARRIRECPCEHGCPACVGPVNELTQERDLKQDTLSLIQALR